MNRYYIWNMVLRNTRLNDFLYVIHQQTFSKHLVSAGNPRAHGDALTRHFSRPLSHGVLFTTRSAFHYNLYSQCPTQFLACNRCSINSCWINSIECHCALMMPDTKPGSRKAKAVDTVRSSARGASLTFFPQELEDKCLWKSQGKMWPLGQVYLYFYM